MAASSPLSGVQQPARSISLPSRLSPNFMRVEAELSKLKSWETLTASGGEPFGAEAIQVSLTSLVQLYTCVEDLIQSPSTHQALLNHDGGKLVNDAVEGSIALLDTCSTARYLMQLLKEHVQDLQSALRRRGGYMGAADNISTYMNFRKKVEKDAAKCLRALKQTENRSGFATPLDTDPDLATVVRVLSEVNAITTNIFQYLLSFLHMPVVKSKASGWSLISKLVSGGSLASRVQNSILNEVGAVDVALFSLHRNGQGDDAKSSVQLIQGRLRTLEASIQSLEAWLDRLFRHLVQNRVSLLNTVTS
ncbi:hypothetical protein Ancab_026668 [Ancistrocladus abbreviatus]